MSRIGVAAYVLREIWVARCRATYDDTPISVRDICLKVNQHVQLLNLIHSPKKPSKNIHLYMLETLGLDRKPPRIHRGLWCKWDKPSPGWFKLNVDGSAKGDAISGGGIIRDEDRHLVAAFSHFYGNTSNNLTEFLALRDGMLLCKSLNISRC